MREYVFFYLIGALCFGELLLMTWWAMRQPKPATPMDYLRQKWAHAVFSGTLAAVNSVLWGEGYYTNLFGQGHVTLSRGWSLVMGSFVCFFAHSIIWGIGKTKIGKMLGLAPPTFENEQPPPPPVGDNPGGP